MLAAHTQRLRRDLFKIALARKEQMDRIIGRRLLSRFILALRWIVKQTAARFGVFLSHILQLGNDDGAYFFAVLQN